VKFTWTNDLSFDQLADLVSNLPPRSFVLLGLLMRDASGVTFNMDDALTRLSAVSRAPINGIFQHQVGLGIVGGRLYQGELEGTESARVSARILRGEPASNFPPLVIGTREPLYDWRQLRRHGISESRLPPGSVVMFRQPTAWERYRRHVLFAIAVIIAQAVLIFALLFQRRRRSLVERAYQKSQAEVLQKRDELAHVSRVTALGQLSASLAHEVNQPLAAILSNASAASRFLDAPQPDLREVRDALADISSDTRRAGEIVRRLRDMLKRDTAGFTSVDLNHVIRTVERILHSDAIRHGVTVRLDLSPGVLPVTGDDVQLQQVLLNLMVNAFAAMSEPGLNGRPRELIVRTQPTAASAPDGSASHGSAPAAALVEVQDRGTGIPPERLESIFEPFITSKSEGLGMGLAICRTLIERHGGRIWAANNPNGDGATFSLTLPITRDTDRISGEQPPRTAEPPTAAPSPNNSPGRELRHDANPAAAASRSDAGT
jgi:signal transduction histidine kinase